MRTDIHHLVLWIEIEQSGDMQNCPLFDCCNGDQKQRFWGWPQSERLESRQNIKHLSQKWKENMTPADQACRENTTT